MDEQTTLQQLKDEMAHFVRSRHWGKYHRPKDLAMSLAIEAAELMEHFQWAGERASREALADGRTRGEIADEMSDVLAFLLSLANVTGIDLAESFRRKMKKNELKYPVEQVKGVYRRPRRQ